LGISAHQKFTQSELREIFDVCSRKELTGNWNKIRDILNTRLKKNYNESTYRKRFCAYVEMKNACKEIDPDFTGDTTDVMVQKRELEKERKKLQTDKLEYNRWLRDNAREEMVYERIADGIANLTPIDVPSPRSIAENNRGAVLCLADAHFNTEFEIKGLFGEVLNSYSPEIFYQRMWYLRDKVKEICERENITSLHIFGLGDDNDGLLRLTDNLFKLRWGVIDSALIYADFMANWINEVSKFVNVDLQMIEDSNHNQLRLCSAPKNAFKGENLSKVIIHTIKTRLQDNPCVTITQNPTGYIYANVVGYNLMGIHGEVKSLKTAIDNLSRLYGLRVDYLIGGHKHHAEEYGFDCEGISVGSIIGIDDYSTSLMRSSNASATMLIFEEGNGLVTKHTIKLN
jgi:hypothetical protein